MTSIDTVIAALERTPEIVIPLVREVPEANLKRRPQPDKWSVHEHACHLADVHDLIMGRLDLMLAEDHPTIKPYQPHLDDEEGNLLTWDLDESLERFAADRRRLVERARALTPAEWERTAEHGEYSHYSVFIMLRHIAMHDLFHAWRIEELLLKKDW